MAQEALITGTEHRVKLRSPWAAALLPIITLGIYHLVWWYRINRELRDYGNARGYDLGQNPTSSALALFPGGLIIVPALVSYWRGTQRIQGAARLADREPINGWVALLLYLLLSLGLWAYMQWSLNEVWRAEARALPGDPPLGPGPDQMPPRLPEQPAPAERPEPAQHPGGPSDPGGQ